MVTIRSFQSTDLEAIISLIAQFRVTLASFKHRQILPNLEEARNELEEYLAQKFPIYIAEVDEHIVGYLVCRVIENVVWVESLFVHPKYRRLKIGSTLYHEAEVLAEQNQQSTVYNWIHPNNDIIIQFLQKQGYTALNLIELRKPFPKEQLSQKLRIGNYEYQY